MQEAQEVQDLEAQDSPPPESDSPPSEETQESDSPPEQDQESPPPDTEVRAKLNAVAKALREREKIDAAKREAAEYKQVIEQLQREVASQREWRQKLLEDPVQAIQEAGIDPDHLGLRMAGKKPDPSELKFQKLEKTLEQVVSKLQAAEAEKQRQQAMHQQQEAQKTRQEFVNYALEKFPRLKSTYTLPFMQEALAAEANRVAAAYYQRTGEAASWQDIAEYLDSMHISPSPQAEGSGDAASPKREAGANGTRTLTPSKASEKRSAPKSRDDMTPEELREHLISVVKQASK